jgi:hypothetical protein
VKSGAALWIVCFWRKAVIWFVCGSYHRLEGGVCTMFAPGD